MKKSFSQVSVLFFIIVIFGTSVSAQLYHQTNEAGLLMGEFTPRLTSSPSDFKYFIYSTISGYDYADYIDMVADSWDSTEYEISITRTTDYDISICDIGRYYGDWDQYSDYQNFLAYTIVYCGDGPYSDNQQSYEESSEIPEDYFSTEVKLNLSTFTLESLSNSAILKKFIPIRLYVPYQMPAS